MFSLLLVASFTYHSQTSITYCSKFIWFGLCYTSLHCHSRWNAPSASMCRLHTVKI